MSSRSSALVLLAPAFPALESETNWVPSQQVFVAAMRERYPDVRLIVLTFYYPNERKPYRWRGVDVIPFDGREHRRVRRWIFWRRIWKELNRIRSEYELHGLLSFWVGECAAVGHYFGIRYGIPHYSWICGQDARATNKWVRRIRPAAGELIAMSDFLVEEFARNHGIRPLRMIPNAIDPGVFPVASGGRRDIHLLAVGSLSRLKRYKIFIDAVAIIRPSLPSVRAVLCGEGEERQQLVELADQYRLGGHLTMTGELPHEEVLGLMQRTKIFLHPSEYEGFGIVCLEALYAGAHVISMCKPLKEDIPHWHVVANEEEMIRKVLSLLEQESLDDASVVRYTIKESVEEIMGLYAGRTGNSTPGW
jgi:glycosyltransferase involved in cell wall biosynthesis